MPACCVYHPYALYRQNSCNSPYCSEQLFAIGSVILGHTMWIHSVNIEFTDYHTDSHHILQSGEYEEISAWYQMDMKYIA